MFFKSKKPEPIKEDSRIKDLQIITQMNQEFATSLDLNETLQNSLEVIIKRILFPIQFLILLIRPILSLITKSDCFLLFLFTYSLVKATFFKWNVSCIKFYKKRNHGLRLDFTKYQE